MTLDKRDLIYIEQSISINIDCLEDFQPIDYVKQVKDLKTLMDKIKQMQKEVE